MVSCFSHWHSAALQLRTSVKPTVSESALRFSAHPKQPLNTMTLRLVLSLLFAALMVSETACSRSAIKELDASKVFEQTLAALCRQDYVGARSSIDDALLLNRSNAFYLNGRGVLAARQGDLKMAFDSFISAYSLAQTDQVVAPFVFLLAPSRWSDIDARRGQMFFAFPPTEVRLKYALRSPHEHLNGVLYTNVMYLLGTNAGCLVEIVQARSSPSEGELQELVILSPETPPHLRSTADSFAEWTDGQSRAMLRKGQPLFQTTSLELPKVRIPNGQYLLKEIVKLNLLSLQRAHPEYLSSSYQIDKSMTNR